METLVSIQSDWWHKRWIASSPKEWRYMTHIFSENPDFVTLTLIEKSEYALTNLGIQHPLHRLGQNSASTKKIWAKFSIQQL